MKNRKQEQLEILTACKRTLFMVGYLLWDELILSVTMDLGFTLAKCLLALCGGALLHALGALPQRKTAAFGLQSAACICVSVLYVSQSIYFSIFHTPYYLKSLLGLGKALEFSDVALRAAAKNAGMLTVFAVQLLLMFTVYRKWFWQRVQRPPCAFSLLTAIWMCTLALCLSLSDGREPVSPRMQLLQSFVPSASLRTFGLLPTMEMCIRDRNSDLHTITVQQIADAAGIGKGTLYEYFSSREEIFAKAFLYRLENEFSHLEESLRKTQSFEERLKVLLRAADRVLEMQNVGAQVLAVCSGETNELEQFCTRMNRSYAQRVEELLALTVQQGVEEGVLRKPESMRYAVLAMFSGLTGYISYRRAHPSEEGVEQDTIQILLRSLR